MDWLRSEIGKIEVTGFNKISLIMRIWWKMICGHSRIWIILDIFYRPFKTCSILTKTNRRLQTRYVAVFYTLLLLLRLKMLSEKMYSIWFTLTFASPNRKQRDRPYIVNLIQVQSKKTLRNYKKCPMRWENPFQSSPMKICMGKCSNCNNPRLRLLMSYWLI